MPNIVYIILNVIMSLLNFYALLYILYPEYKTITDEIKNFSAALLCLSISLVKSILTIDYFIILYTITVKLIKKIIYVIYGYFLLFYSIITQLISTNLRRPKYNKIPPEINPVMYILLL